MKKFKKRDLNISFYKAGNNGITTRLILPKSWLAEIRVTENNRIIELIFDEEKKQLIKGIITSFRWNSF